MSKPSTLFRLGDVITGEPHLYLANPCASDSFVEAAASEPPKHKLLTRFLAAVQRTFRFGPTPGDALAAGLDRAFMP
jgi:hypothetical protein